MSSSLRVFAFSILVAFAGVTAVTSQASAQTEPDASVEESVGSATQGLQGRPNAANSAACASCATAGARSEAPPLAIAGVVLALGAVVSRRRSA